MTFCSTLSSFALTTFWVIVLGSTIELNTDGVSLPYLQLLASLLSLVIPLCLGILFAKKRPEIAKRVRIWSRPVFLFAIIVGVVSGVYINRKVFLLLRWRHVVAGVILGGSGYTIGALTAKLAGLNRSQ